MYLDKPWHINYIINVKEIRKTEVFKSEIIVVLCAGDKSTQQFDIEMAKKLVIEERVNDGNE
jgi:hypothetical protein